MPIVNCSICLNPFDNYGHQKLSQDICCQRCADIREFRRRRKWEETHPETRKAIAEKRNLVRRMQSKRIKILEQGGEPNYWQDSQAQPAQQVQTPADLPQPMKRLLLRRKGGVNGN